MPLPTLYHEGKAIPPKGASKEVIKYYKEARPVDIITKWIKTRMPEYGASPAKTLNDRVLLVEAKTGSGKSTAMPVELYRILRPETAKDYSGPGVICTEPTILTTMTIPHDITEWAPDMKMGETIGYSTGSAKQKVYSGLLFATTGTLLAQLRTLSYSTIMGKYRFIVLDEVHNRSLELDMTMMLLKKMLLEVIKEPECPFVILTSATFDAPKFAKYFGINPETNIISVIGQSQPITETFLKQDSSNVLASIGETVKEIHDGKINPMKQGQGDILIFVPGMGEIKKVYAQLLLINVGYIKAKEKCFILLKIDGKAVATNSKDIDLAFADYDKLTLNDEGEYDWKGTHGASRRVIIATNVAETGITIPTLGHVIDIGIYRSMEHYSPINMTGLLTKTAPKTMITQRRGRAGRLFPGHYYGMYTEETYNHLTPTQLPSIVTDNINSVILDILLQQNDCFDINKIDMLDIPSVDSLKESIELNIVLGYIDSNYGECFKATKFGEMIRSLRYSTPEEFRMILSSYIYDVSTSDIVSIVAMSGVWLRKANMNKILKESLPAFFFEDDDYVNTFTQLTLDDFIRDIFILEAFNNKLMKGVETAEKWCKDVGLDFAGMMNVLTKKYEVMNDVINASLDPFYLSDYNLITSTKINYFNRIRGIKRCIYDGYILNLIHNDKETMSYKNRFGFAIKARFNRDQGHPKYIITDKIKIDDNSTNPKYNLMITTERVSVLDGYICIDDDYLSPSTPNECTLKAKDMSAELGMANYLSILKVVSTTKLMQESNPKLTKYITQ
jgi:HrpA-like RNA helicase